MDADTLIGVVRSDYLDDDVEPYRWGTDKLLRWADAAQKEACRRQRLLVDETTLAVCQVTTAALTPSYDLDPRVHYVEHMRRPTGEPVEKTTQARLDAVMPYWRNLDPDYPTHYLQDGLRITLVPTPAIEEALTLRVWRLPLASLEDVAVELEIDPAYHEDLAHYVAARALRMPDEDLRDLNLAKWHEDEFDKVFGPPMRADVIAHKRREGGVSYVQPGHIYHGRRSTRAKPFDIC